MMSKIKNAIYIILGVAGVLWYITLIPQDYRNWQSGYEGKRLWDEVEFRDSVAAYQSYIERYPSGKYVDEARPRIRGQEFQVLRASQKIELIAPGLENRKIGVRVRRGGISPLTVRIPAGTSFVSDEDSQSSLVAVEDSAVRLSTQEWYSITVSVACLSAACPKSDVGRDRFVIQSNPDVPLDSRLIEVINHSDLAYSAKQAMVWIAMEDLTYDSLSSTALLGGDSSAQDGHVDRHAALVAMRAYDSAGFDITQTNIWKDRDRLSGNEKDEDLKQWAKRRTREAEQMAIAGFARALLETGVVSAADEGITDMGNSYMAPVVSFALKSGMTIYPILDGRIKEVRVNADGGKGVTVASSLRGQTIEFIYENIRKLGVEVKVGQFVKKKDPLGTSGVSNSPTQPVQIHARCNGQPVDPSEYLNTAQYQADHRVALESGSSSAMKEIDDRIRHALAKAIEVSYLKISGETREFIEELPMGKATYENLIMALAWSDTHLDPFYDGSRALGILQPKAIELSSRIYLHQKSASKSKAQFKERLKRTQDDDKRLSFAVEKGVLRGAMYFDKVVRYVLERTHEEITVEKKLLLAIAAYKEGISVMSNNSNGHMAAGKRKYILSVIRRLTNEEQKNFDLAMPWVDPSGKIGHSHYVTGTDGVSEQLYEAKVQDPLSQTKDTVNRMKKKSPGEFIAPVAGLVYGGKKLDILLYHKGEMRRFSGDGNSSQASEAIEIRAMESIRKSGLSQLSKADAIGVFLAPRKMLQKWSGEDAVKRVGALQEDVSEYYNIDSTDINFLLMSDIPVFYFMSGKKYDLARFLRYLPDGYNRIRREYRGKVKAKHSQEHPYIELEVKKNSPVWARLSGKILAVDVEPEGWVVTVSSRTQASAGKKVSVVHRYSHLSGALIWEGDSVKKGEVIGVAAAGKAGKKQAHYHLQYRLDGRIPNSIDSLRTILNAPG